MLGPILLTRKYKNFSLPAEIFASLAFIRKFRKNLDLAHITRCTVLVMVTRRDKAASSHSLNKLLHEYGYLRSLETFGMAQ